jgi:MarR family transcriptional regulator, 2-MHQ and catechol-resistance regulon repressor
MEDINLKLVIAMARSYEELFAQIEMNVRGFGLTLSEFGVLEMIHHKGRQPIQKIAEKILVTSGTITYVIDKLLQRELVYRERCKTDKRITYVNLTNTGEMLITEIFPKHKQFLDELMQGMSVSEKEILIGRLVILQETINSR